MAIDEGYEKFTCKALMISGILLLGIAGLNWFIDPYGVWQESRISGLNNFMILSGHERLYKMIRLSREDNMEVLFLGSSTVYYALDPETMVQLTGKKSYNAGIPSAHLLEMKELLLQAIHFHPELDEVVLGLNWFMFFPNHEGMEKEFPKGQVGEGSPVGKRAVIILLSMDALNDSIRTIKESRRAQDNIMESDGKLNPEVLRKTHARQRDFDRFSDDTIGNLRNFRAHIPYCSPMMNAYASLVAICKENNIKVTVYINPVHSTFLEGIYACDADMNFEEWKCNLIKLSPVWDFSGHSKVTDEPFSLTRKYWRNAQHPMLTTGDLILKKVTGNNLPEDVEKFGVLLTENNVDEVLKKERDAHMAWKKENPEMVQRVKAIVDSH